MTGQFRFLFLTIAILLLCSPTYAAQDSFFSDPSDITITDDAYDGTLGSMASDAIDTSGTIPAGSTINDVTVDLSITQDWIGDLVIKLASPNGTVLTLMSRPGLSESADDGNDCCGDTDDLDGTTITFSDVGVTDAENMGAAGGNICSVDGLCSYSPNPGTGPGTDFLDFAGEDPSGVWTLYVGDASGGMEGTLNSWTLDIDYDAPAGVSTATTQAATSVDVTSAILNGLVNANGEDSTVTFEYGFDTAYGTTVAAVPSLVTGSTDTAVSAPLTSLAPGTTYHFRVVSTNLSGTTNGDDMTFTTGVVAAAIPTLSEWGMIIMSLMMAGSAFWMMRRRVS